jgi:hypothetical protein
MSTFVFSIRHEFAEKIYSGEKTVELRSVLPANPALKAGDSVALYETKPIGRITGSFAAAEDASYDASNTLGLCLSVLAKRSCVTTDYVERHSNLRIKNPEAVNDQKATWQIGAVKIRGPIRFGESRPLSDYGLKRAPQSWCRAKKEPTAPREEI